MDTRRRLILLSASALPVLFSACAGARSPRLAITTPRPIAAAVVQPLAPPPALTLIAVPKLALRTCRTVHVPIALHRRASSCALRAAEVELARARPHSTSPQLPVPPQLSQSPQLIKAVERRVAPIGPKPTLFSFQARPVQSPIVQAKVALPAPIPTGPVDHMEGAARVFAYTPGRLYAVRAEPLRVTLVSLQPGETLIDKAAGDTVRWQIGETTSGEGAGLRSLVVIKPLTAGLSTNLVLTTTKRVYLIELSSVRGGSDPAIAWAYPAPPVAVAPAPVKVSEPEALALTDSRSGRYRIAPVGGRPGWTPATVFDDGRRTFIAFTPDLERSAAPLLFVSDGAGAPALVNYRQRGDVYIVDRLFDAAELRLGDKKPQVVRITRMTEVASR